MPLLRAVVLALAAALAISSASLSSAAAAESAAKRGGTLEFAVLVEPGNYDCHGNISFAFLHPIAPHYSTLLKFDAPNYPQIVGDLAESWNVSPDRLTYTFKLRPNILFHDGSKMSSADVKASYERIVHPPPGVVSSRKVDYAAIASIDTPDPRTVVFHLQWPSSPRTPSFPRATSLAPERSSFPSMSKANSVAVCAGTNISNPANLISMATAPTL